MFDDVVVRFDASLADEDVEDADPGGAVDEGVGALAMFFPLGLFFGVRS